MAESRIDYILNAAQATTEATKLEASFAGVGKAAQSAGVAGAAGMTQVETAAKMPRAALAELQNLYRLTVEAQGAASAGAQQLAAELQRQGVAVGGATAAVQENTVVLEQNAVAHATVSEASGMTARQVVILGAAIGRLTGITLQGSRALGTLAGSFSLAALPQLAVIIGVSLLISQIIKLIKAKNELIAINEEGIKVDLAVAAATGELAARQEAERRVTADLEAVLLRYRDVHLKVQQALLSEKSAQAALVDERLQASIADGQYENQMVSLTAMFGNSRTALQEQTEARLKDEVELKKTVDELIHMSAVQGKTNEDTLAAARAIGVEGAALQALTEDLDKGRLALEAYNLAAQAFKIPGTGFDKTTAAQGEAERQLTDRINQQNAAGMNKLEMARLNERALKDLIDRQNELNISQARSAGIILTDEQAHARLVSAMGKESADIREQINLLGLLDEKRKKQRDIGPQLEMEIAKAQAHLDKDNFEARLVDIKQEFDIRRQKLVEDQQNTLANRQRLSILESLAIAAATREEAKAVEERGIRELEERQKVQNEVARMEIAASDNEIFRMRQTIIQTGLEKEQQVAISVRKRLITEAEGNRQLADIQIATAEEISRKVGDIAAKALKHREHAEVEMWNTVAAERLAVDKKTIAAGAKILKDSMREAAEINRHFTETNRLDLGNPAQLKRLLDLNTRMRTLGVSVHEVDRIFGTTTRSVEQLEARMAEMERVGVDGLDALAAKIGFAQDAFLAFGNAVAAGFEAMISGSQSFGDAMLASFLRAVAQMAAAKGAFWIAEGIANLVTPGMHAIGAVQLAKGIALEALAGALGGAASLLSGSKSAAAGGGGAATTSGAATSTQRPPNQPTIIPFPTSGGPTTVINFNAQGVANIVTKVLESNGMVSIRTAPAQHRRELKKAVA